MGTHPIFESDLSNRMEVDEDDTKHASSSTDTMNQSMMDDENVHSNLGSNLEMKRKVEKCDGFDLPKAKVKKMKLSFDIEQLMSDTSISDNESEAKKMTGLNDAVIEAVSNMDTRKIQIKKTKKLKKSKFLYRKQPKISRRKRFKR